MLHLREIFLLHLWEILLRLWELLQLWEILLHLWELLHQENLITIGGPTTHYNAVPDTELNAPVELAVDSKASGSGLTDSNGSGTGAGSSLADYNPDLDASINASNPNAESDLDTTIDFHDLPFHDANDVNSELHSPTDLTEHDALPAHEADDHLELEPALAKDVTKPCRSARSPVVKPSLLKERIVFILSCKHFKHLNLPNFLFLL